MKSFFISFISLCALTTTIKAQDTSTVHKYPQTIMLKVKDISSVIDLSPERQSRFAEFFIKEEEQIHVALQTEDGTKQAVILQANLLAEFTSLLSAAEYALYSARKKGSPYAKQIVNQGGSSTSTIQR